MRSRLVRALALCVAPCAAALISACGLGSEELIARDVRAGYDRGDVELRQGESALLTLEVTCEPDANSAEPPGISLEHRFAPTGDQLGLVREGAGQVCATPTNDGFFRGRTTWRLAIGAAAAPGLYQLTTAARHPRFGDTAYATVDVRVMSTQAPRPMSTLTAGGQPSAIVLTWTPEPGDPNPPEGYRLERWDAARGYVPLATLPANPPTYTDTGLAPDIDFLYRLVPFNRHGEGPRATASARALPTPPSPRLHALTLSVGGSAPGRVVSQPAGLDCTGECRAEFAEGSTVTLIATPAANGVVSWSGAPACSGSSLIVQVPLSGPTSCRATFSATPPAVPPGWTSAGSVRTVPGLLGAPAVAFDANGEPTVAYVEQGTSTDRGALRVVRRRGGLWLLVSVDPVNANAPAATGSPGLVLLANGEPVVAWTNETGEMRVSAWNGTAWSPFGNGNLAFGGRTTPASAPQLDRLGDRLVAAWTEATTSGARIVVARWDLAAPSTQPVSTRVVPGAGSSGGLVARLALDRGGNASLLLLRTGITGAELPLRLLRESLGWQTACPDLGSAGGLANTSIGFDVQHDRLRDDSAVVLRPSADYRQVLGARCVNGSWQPLGLSANGVVTEVDNIGRTLRQVRLVAERGGRGPVALVAIDDGYRASTSYVQALLGDAGFEAAPGLERARVARGGTLGAAAVGAGAIGFVQGFELGPAIEIEVWRFAP